ncbi:MAG: response regulator [Gammaproteobacteria bacterium]|jgi:CheY-like chemotaxis protein|nr:response regulator [Gammaproteobacteria bacterium]
MKRILIVDDEPHVIRVVRLALERNGYLVDAAANGKQALEYLEEQHPDLIITDIDMPQMNGKDLCMEINSSLPDRTFHIFVLTARAELEHRKWASAIPNLDFMEKPVSIRRLVSRLDTYFADVQLSDKQECQTAS